MRIAICLSGYVGWQDSSYLPGNGIQNMSNKIENDPVISFNSLKKHIVDVNENIQFDFFIHSWSVNKSKELKDLYKPLDILVEEQDPFDKGELDDYGLGFKSSMKYDNTFRSYSRWNSNYRVLNLWKNYELKHNIKYDCVFITRPDMLYYSDLVFKNYVLDTLWIGDWESTKNSRYMDLLIFSNSDNISGFINEYKNINIYSKNVVKPGVPVDSHSLFKDYVHSFANKIDFFWKFGKEYHTIRSALSINKDINNT